MAKDRTTVSLDPDVSAARKSDSAGFSTLVNEWARQYYLLNRAPVPAGMIQQEIQVLEGIKDDLRESLNEIDGQIEDLERQLADLQSPSEKPGEDGAEYTLEDAKSWWRTQSVNTAFHAEHPAIESWAARVGVEPMELLAVVEDVPRRDEPKSLRSTRE